MKQTWLFLAALPLMAAPPASPVWPQHRGPGGSGIVAGNAPLPSAFNPKEGFKWKVQLPQGKSSPILAGGRLFLTAHDGKKLLTLCINPKSGTEIWRREVEKAREEQRNQLNDPASPTPITDGRAVYSFFADYGLVAYDLEGKELWRTPLGPFESEHGMAAWPAVGSKSIFVQADVSNGAFLAAFDKKTGKQQWRLERRSTIGAYASPIVHRPTKQTELVITSGPFEMAAYDAASGKKVWWVTGLPFQPKSAPVVAGDTVYMNSLGISLPWPDFAELVKQMDKDGNGRLNAQEIEKFGYVRFNFSRLDENKNNELEREEWDPIVRGNNATLAVRIKGTGDQTANILWRHSKSLPDVPQPLVHNGVVYLVRDGGIMTSLNAETGQVVKQGRLPGAIDQYFSSPVYGDGKLFVSSAAGTLTVLRAGGDWEVLSTNDMDEPLWATPAIDGSSMFVRAGNSLYCFDGKRGDLTSSKQPRDLSAFGRFTGKYRRTERDALVIAISDGMLLMTRFGTDIELAPSGDLTFKTRQVTPALLTFVEKDGQIQSVSLDAFGRTLAFTRSDK